MIRLKMKKRKLEIWLLLALLSINFFVVAIAYNTQRSQILEVVDQTQTTTVENNAKRIEDMTLSIISDLYFMKHQFELNDITILEQSLESKLTSTLFSFLNSHPEYSRITILDSEGYIRAQYNQFEQQLESYYPISEQLSSTYLSEVLSLQEDDIYITRVDYEEQNGTFVYHNGEVVPTIRFVAPIVNQDETIAYIMFSMDLSVFINTVTDDFPPYVTLNIVDSHGYYIFSNDETIETQLFGFYDTTNPLVYQSTLNEVHLIEDAQTVPMLFHYEDQTVLIVKLQLDDVRTILDESYNISPNIKAYNNTYYVESTVDLTQIENLNQVKQFYISISILGVFIDFVLVVLLSRVLRERKSRQEVIEYDATHDSLTDTINRKELAARTGKLLLDQTPFLLLFIDYDAFKKTNDLFGHHVGDLLLIYGVERMRSSIRDDDFIARFGGDEFVIILTDIEDSNVGSRLAQELRDRFKEPFQIGSEKIIQEISIGISHSSEYQSVDDLMRAADNAMYQQKHHK